MHTPVLLKEAVEGLNVKKNGLYVDATLGEGGHAKEIISQGGRVLGIDADADQLKDVSLVKNLTLVEGNFANIETIAKTNNFFPVDGILLDLGLSIRQIMNSGRGFSYNKSDEPLDMRLNKKQDLTAAKIVNSFSQNELYEIFAKYSEEVNSLAISEVLVRARSLKSIDEVKDLILAINQVATARSKKVYARIFQALRIAVNDELTNLKKGLEGALKILQKKGRLVVISFHSVEDRLVKSFIKNNGLRQVNKKKVRSTNNLVFERSAKLRIISYEKTN